MSTDSSYLLTWSSILYNDIVKPLWKRPISERLGLLLNRLIVFGIGIFLLIYGLWYELPGRAWDYLSITGSIYLSSISVLLVACCYWRRANTTGALMAIVGGAVSPIIFLLTGLAEHVAIAGVVSYGLAATGMCWGLSWDPNGRGNPVTIPAYLVWFVLTWACILWYGSLILYVGWKSFGEIRKLLANLRRAKESQAAEEV